MSKTELKVEEVEEDVEYLSEEQVKALISRLMYKIECLEDECQSLWFMMEEIEQSNIAGHEQIGKSLTNLKIYTNAMLQKPAMA